MKFCTARSGFLTFSWNSYYYIYSIKIYYSTSSNILESNVCPSQSTSIRNSPSSIFSRSKGKDSVIGVLVVLTSFSANFIHLSIQSWYNEWYGRGVLTGFSISLLICSMLKSRKASGYKNLLQTLSWSVTKWGLIWGKHPAIKRWQIGISWRKVFYSKFKMKLVMLTIIWHELYANLHLLSRTIF